MKLPGNAGSEPERLEFEEVLPGSEPGSCEELSGSEPELVFELLSGSEPEHEF